MYFEKSGKVQRVEGLKEIHVTSCGFSVRQPCRMDRILSW